MALFVFPVVSPKRAKRGCERKGQPPTARVIIPSCHEKPVLHRSLDTAASPESPHDNVVSVDESERKRAKECGGGGIETIGAGRG